MYSPWILSEMTSDAGSVQYQLQLQATGWIHTSLILQEESVKTSCSIRRDNQIPSLIGHIIKLARQVALAISHPFSVDIH